MFVKARLSTSDFERRIEKASKLTSTCSSESGVLLLWYETRSSLSASRHRYTSKKKSKSDSVPIVRSYLPFWTVSIPTSEEDSGRQDPKLWVASQIEAKVLEFCQRLEEDPDKGTPL